MIQSKGYAAQSKDSGLAPFSFERRDPGPQDVVVEIAYCGICHSDIHQVKDEWGGSIYPMVPGHEIVGKVTAVGSDVTRFKAGDLAGVGVMVDSCKVCANCKAKEEAYCEKGFVGTYNARYYDSEEIAQGGYSNNIVVDQRYVHTISNKLESKLAAVAPLLCAGITTYSPLKHWNVGPGMKVGIVGLGALLRRQGHAVYHLRRQGSGRQAPGCGRSRHLQGQGRDGQAEVQLRLHPGLRRGPA
jgi:uncharacterized zinc-type alcohol dehydrogenase-like protein